MKYLNPRLIKVEAEMERLKSRISDLRQANTKYGLNSCRSYPKETGAIRRSSLDLTRALAELRRPRFS